MLLMNACTFFFPVCLMTSCTQESTRCIHCICSKRGQCGLRIAGTVGQTEFDQAILRAVAGVEKKRSVLQGAEKESVAKHECGHALVSTAVAALVPTSPQVCIAALITFLCVLCCAVLCCGVLSCAVPCCAVPCCAVLCCAVLCFASLCGAVLCCTVLGWCTVPRCAVLSCPVLL